VADRKPVGEFVDAASPPDAQRASGFIAPDADVLIVDDFPSNLLVAEGLLIPYRMRVFTCANGREAVELVRRQPFDLVLMDHMMPGMDGVEATRVIRSMDEERCRTMPVVALTADAADGAPDLFLQNGFNDLLSKPIEVTALNAVLKKWIPAEKRRQPTVDDEPQPQAAERKQPFLSVEGVDVAAGLARLGGSHDLYRDLLGLFRRDAEASVTRLAEEPGAASLSEFTTLVHALKSGLAGIGADSLSQSAALLEKAGRRGDFSCIRERLASFREELAALVERLGEALAAPAAGRKDEEGPLAPKVVEALKRLRDALQAEEYAEIDDALAHLQALPLPDAVKGDVDDTEVFILRAEFSSALDAVNAVLEREK
jgi:CheY-like chemotaxis protein